MGRLDNSLLPRRLGNDIEIIAMDGGSIEGVTINITEVLGKSMELSELCTRREEYKRILRDLDPNKPEIIEHYQHQLLRIEEDIKKFKRDIVKIAEYFNQIAIDTKEIIKAKTLFEEGKIAELDSFMNTLDLESDLQIMQKRQEELEKFDKQKNALSEAFLIRAKLTLLDQQKLDKIKIAKSHFENSLLVSTNIVNQYEYACFLAEDAQEYPSAIQNFKKVLDLKDISESYIAKVHYNLTAVYLKAEMFRQAIEYGTKYFLSDNLMQRTLYGIYFTASALYNISIACFKLNKPTQALNFMNKSLEYRKLLRTELSGSLTAIPMEVKCLTMLSYYHIELSDPKSALEYLNLSIVRMLEYFEGKRNHEDVGFPLEIPYTLSHNLVSILKSSETHKFELDSSYRRGKLEVVELILKKISKFYQSPKFQPGQRFLGFAYYLLSLPSETYMKINNTQSLEKAYKILIEDNRLWGATNESNYFLSRIAFDLCQMSILKLIEIDSSKFDEANKYLEGARKYLEEGESYTKQIKGDREYINFLSESIKDLRKIIEKLSNVQTILAGRGTVSPDPSPQNNWIIVVIIIITLIITAFYFS